MMCAENQFEPGSIDSRLRLTAQERDISAHAEHSVQLKDILDFAPVAMGWAEDESRIEYVNRQFTLLFGYTLDDLPNLETWYMRAYPDEHYRETVVGPWRKAVAQAQRNDMPLPDLETEITCKDGSVRSIIVHLIWVGHRRMVSFTDITERKRMEDALRASEAKSRDHDRLLQAVLESSPEVIVFALDHKYCYLAFNDKHRATMLAIWGKTITVGMNMLDVIGTHPDREKARQGFDRALAGEAFVTEDAYGDEAILRLYWQIFYAPILGENGSTIGLTCFVLNITERRRAEQALAERERELRTLVENLPDNISRYTTDARNAYVSPSLERVLGKPKEDLLGRTPTECASDADTVEVERRIRAVAATGVSDEMEYTLPVSDGETRYHLLRFVAERDGSNQVTGVLGIGTDITERRRSERRIQAHDAMLEMVARDTDLTAILNAIVRYMESEDKTSQCSIMLVDAAGKHLLVGAAPSLPASLNEVTNGIEIGVGIGSCGTAAAQGQRVVVEDIQTHEYWCDIRELAQSSGLRSCWSEPILSSKGKVLGTFDIYHAEPQSPYAVDFERIAFATNLAAIAIENRQVREKLEQQAHYDYLTGLDNRRYFLGQAEIELARTLRYDRKLSILMIDIDHFKLVNDTYGHKVGDIVLQKFASVCRSTLRNIDIIGRIGGEEFAVLLPETGPEQAMKAAERLRAALAVAQVELDSGLQLHFTASFGVVALEEKGTNIDILLNQADHALYLAKNEGRNRVCLYRNGMSGIPLPP